MSKLNIIISRSALGSEGDFADVLRSFADQIDECVEYSDEFVGSASAASAQGSWSIEEGE